MTSLYLYPVTVICSRYGGVYEGGPWVAFNLEPQQIDLSVHGDDIECSAWFDAFDGHYGFGSTPSAAVEHLHTLDAPLRMKWDPDRYQFLYCTDPLDRLPPPVKPVPKEDR